MSQVSILFQGLLSVAAVSMIVLGVGALMTRPLRQPIERVRCIQWTLVALVVALLVRQAALLPSFSLQVLPAESVAATASGPLSHGSTGEAPPLDTALAEAPFVAWTEAANIAAEAFPAIPPVTEATPRLSWKRSNTSSATVAPST